ncbi:DNA cytosine methyltransferase [Deinococcus detaillensis]|nr:DNA cytosine methyltransferase [Deinococcus detaillensis]
MTYLSKALRIADGARPRVLDIFSGAGGISLGFHAAGFRIAANLEIDAHAAATHGHNFHPGSPEHAVARDITETMPQQLADALGLGPVSEAFDVLVGGPPCQAYARVGRSKLREIAEHPEAFLHDHRASLFEKYLAYVTACQPLALLMENVPDIMNQRGVNVAEVMAEALDEAGYTVAYTLLNAAFYGVPQMRERMFLVAYRQELGQPVVFPKATHDIDLPIGYEGSRQVALKVLNVAGDLFGESTDHHYVDAPRTVQDPADAITTGEAIGDLPVITEHLTGEMSRGARRFDGPVMPYRKDVRPTPYVQLMRTWKGFETPGGVRDHAIRSLPRDYMIFRRMNPGDQYPEALKHAHDLFREKLMALEDEGRPIKQDSDLWHELRSSMIPPYDPGKFPNKWRKMEGDAPARTLLAHLGKDGYSHIHPDSAQARTISVREAARLQSFPDGFVFRGTMNPAFKQIGNAVPPLMSKAIAEKIMAAITAGAAHMVGAAEERVLVAQTA